MKPPSPKRGAFCLPMNSRSVRKYRQAQAYHNWREQELKLIEGLDQNGGLTYPSHLVYCSQYRLSHKRGVVYPDSETAKGVWMGSHRVAIG